MKRPTQAGGTGPSARSNATQSASYVGSSEHKDKRWWGGLPTSGSRRELTTLTTICPLTTGADRDRATRWIRQAIGSGQYKFVEGDRDFPKHVWHREPDGEVWYGRCSNRSKGEYKGWPINEDERREIFD